MDDEASEDRFREGTVIAGKYALTRTLGQGGMGLVVAADHLQLERKVAIKFLLPQHLAKPDVVGRFTREARSAAKIQNDHVAHVLDVGVDEGTPYMVMEYLEGEDLKEILKRRGPLAVEESVRYIVQACEALAEAHALGIVHRDLKPANLFLANRANGKNILKVLDFGISKIMNPATETELTLTSRAVGSPSYMSPEQLTASRSLDGRADVWALGIVLYELLTRRRPFHGDSMPSIVALILRGQFERLDWVRDDLPRPVVDAVHKCLELDPKDRFSSVTELSQALMPFAPAESVSNVDGIPRPRTVSSATLAVGEESIPGNSQSGTGSAMIAATQPPGPNVRARLFLAAGLGGVLTLALVAVALRKGPTTDVAPAAVAASPPPVTAETPPRAPPPLPSAPPPVPSTASVPEAPTPSSTEAPAPPEVVAHPPAAVHVHPPVSHPPPAAAPVKPAAPASAPSCHLVSYFDALGDKHFKEECP